MKTDRYLVLVNKKLGKLGSTLEMENRTSAESSPVSDLMLKSYLALIQQILEKGFAFQAILITPLWSIIGVAFNTAIIMVMPKCLAIHWNAKVYYGSISIADLTNLSFLHFLLIFPVGLAILTEGAISLPVFEKFLI